MTEYAPDIPKDYEYADFVDRPENALCSPTEHPTSLLIHPRDIKGKFAVAAAADELFSFFGDKCRYYEHDTLEELLPEFSAATRRVAQQICEDMTLFEDSGVDSVSLQVIDYDFYRRYPASMETFQFHSDNVSRVLINYDDNDGNTRRIPRTLYLHHDDVERSYSDDMGETRLFTEKPGARIYAAPANAIIRQTGEPEEVLRDSYPTQSSPHAAPLTWKTRLLLSGNILRP